MNLSEVERKKNLNLNCSIRTWMPFNVIFWLKLGFLREFSEGISVEWQIAPGEVQIYWTGKCWMVLAVKVLSCYQEINKCGIRIINLVRIRVGGRDTKTCINRVQMDMTSDSLNYDWSTLECNIQPKQNIFSSSANEKSWSWVAFTFFHMVSSPF